MVFNIMMVVNIKSRFLFTILFKFNMMKKLLFLLFLFTIFSSNAQDLQFNLTVDLKTYLVDYKGTTVNGKANGQGAAYDTKNNGKKIYEGSWKDDILEGNGTRYYEKGEIYKGNFENNKCNGFGTMNFTNGDSYEGYWKNDYRTGKGKYRWSNGGEFIGDFNQNVITGYGIMKEANGNVYEGNLLNNAYSGAGMMVYKNGDKYLGYFVNNRREGRGAHQYANGKIEDGMWKADQYIPPADLATTKTFEEGIYNGKLVNGNAEGLGSMKFNDGRKYEGEWKNNKFNGTGRLTLSNGLTYEGTWENGQLINGQKNYGDGEFYLGKLINDEYHDDEGIYNFPDKSFLIVPFRNGKQVLGYGKYVKPNGCKMTGDFENYKPVGNMEYSEECYEKKTYYYQEYEGDE